jgi:hypothetical protein
VSSNQIFNSSNGGNQTSSNLKKQQQQQAQNQSQSQSQGGFKVFKRNKSISGNSNLLNQDSKDEKLIDAFNYSSNPNSGHKLTNQFSYNNGSSNDNNVFFGNT